MNRLFRALAPFIALAGGVMFLIFGIHTAQQRRVYAETVGEITDIRVIHGMEDDRHEVYVAYTVDGVDYESELGEYASTMRVGKEIGILYDPADPAQIISASAFGMVMEFGMSALAFFLAAAMLIKRLNGR